MMTQRERRHPAGGRPSGDSDVLVDLTGELVRVSSEDVQAGILLRLAHTNRDVLTSGIAGTAVIVGIFATFAPWWQVALFAAARLAAAVGTALLSQRALRLGAAEAVRQGYLLGIELWFAAVALSWSCAIFMAPSPLLSRPASVLALMALIAVEGVTVLVAAVSRRTILFVVTAFWSSLTLRALLDHGTARNAFLICIALYHVVLTMHALNMQRQTERTVRAEIINRALLDRVTRLHHTVRQQRDELAEVNEQLGTTLQQTTALANFDSLTGLLNRRAFLDRAASELSGMRRHGRGAAVVLLDLDRFKTVNDVFGHAVGDAVLARSAEALTAELRGTDVLARWGGEEFIVLLPGSNEDEAATCAERYRSAMAAATSPAWPVGMQITASFGVAELMPGQTFDDALAAADRALYCAKSAGRNAVCRASTTARPS